MVNEEVKSQVPKRPDSIRKTGNRRIKKELAGEFVPVSGYGPGQQRILQSLVDKVELEISPEIYERMENDPTIIKSKKIILTNVLSDEMQFAPGANEKEVSPKEYDNYLEILRFCNRLIEGLDKPYRKTLWGLTGNAIRHGNGVGEIEWEYRRDDPSENIDYGPSRQPKKRGRFSAFFASLFWADEEDTEEETNPLVKKRREQPDLRLMPKGIKVKPREATRFVVDEYFNMLGLKATRNGGLSTGVRWDEILDRRKFIVFTMNEENEDPRGKSSYRPIVNWYNLKTQIPAEILRYIVEEIVPKAVYTLPTEAQPYEVRRDDDGNVVYLEGTSEPELITLIESAEKQMENFRSGSGGIIPPTAKLEPFKKSGAMDAEVFNYIISIIETQMDNGLLLQPLAQSEGAHQARSAAETHKELLNAMVFWIRWLLAVTTVQDILKVAVEINYGPEFVKYLPFISLGDFVRRDWVKELEAIAKAYFQGFLDDTQRRELMAWLNLPEPGPSRQEVMAQIDPTNGEPVMPNNNRPDKQSGNKDRNKGNGTEKENDNKNTRSGPGNFLGYYGKRFVRYTGNLLQRY